MFIFKRRDLFTMLNELRAGTLSSVKIMEEVVERSMASQKTPIPMEYFAHQDFATMLDEAFKADDNYHKGVNRRLEGLPIAVKDNNHPRGAVSSYRQHDPQLRQLAVPWEFAHRKYFLYQYWDHTVGHHIYLVHS